MTSLQANGRTAEVGNLIMPIITAKDFSSVGARVPSPTGFSAGSAGPSSGTIKPALGSEQSELSRLRESLQKSEEFNQALLQTLADLVFELRKDGLIIAFHAPAKNEFHLTAETVVGRRIMDVVTTHIGQVAMHYLEKAFRTGQAQTFICQYLLPGKLRHFEVAIAMRGASTAIAMVRDVTDREMLEREVVESSNRVEMRIGQDIHDGLGQHLTGITFLSRALEKNLAAKDLPEATEAAEISKLVIEALAQTRNLARGLFPVDVESTSLCQSLRELSRTMEQMFNICCSIECAPDLIITHKGISTHLFRLAQEATNNAVKHGKAHRLSILLGTAEDEAILRITDDGVGFPHDSGRKTGLGLRIMAYRAQKVGGTLEIQPGQHGGTVVTCTFNPTNDEN
jgi:two-component system, LuxR family, sensor kinase FixL